jgi:DNA-binding response OmpR family regulator
MTTTTATPQTAAAERQPVVGKILIVEDSSMVRLKLAHSLREQGHTVTAAEDGLQAPARLETDQFDCMLLDLMMPEMSGHEVLRRMRNDSRWYHLPVIVVSALEDLDSMVQCIEMGAEDYLFKPFNPVLLTARVQATLQKKKLRDLEQSYVAQEIGCIRCTVLRPHVIPDRARGDAMSGGTWSGDRETDLRGEPGAHKTDDIASDVAPEPPAARAE